jgi:hypothetical protein
VNTWDSDTNFMRVRGPVPNHPSFHLEVRQHLQRGQWVATASAQYKLMAKNHPDNPGA